MAIQMEQGAYSRLQRLIPTLPELTPVSTVDAQEVGVDFWWTPTFSFVCSSGCEVVLACVTEATESRGKRTWQRRAKC